MPGLTPIPKLLESDERHSLTIASPRYATTTIGDGLTFETYKSSGMVEVPEAEVRAHVLILRTGSPSVIEWCSGGRDRKAVLSPGSVSLFPPGLRDAARVFRPQLGVSSILQIRPAFFDRSIAEIARGARVELVERSNLDDPQIVRLMQSLCTDIAAGSPSGRLFGESIGVALSAHIAQRYSATDAKLEAFRGGLSPARLKRVLEYIDANLGDNLELGRLAEIADLNLHHFARGFKRSTGETPHQYVLRKRIERARRLLHESRLSVLETSARTGFVDQSHFSKVFRRIVGVAPSEYRLSA